MKRSRINRAIHDAMSLFSRLNYHLPPWADWSPERWLAAGDKATELRNHGLGWIVTDFGGGDFEKMGLTICVVSNGRLVDGKPATTQTYAEKVFAILPGQMTPWHFHWMKTETLRNQAGGRLKVQLAWPNGDERTLSDREVDVQIDGMTSKVPAGGEIILSPGQRITFPPMLSHLFSGHHQDGKVFAGEVSSLNDDGTDNCFLDRDVSGQPIVEDEAPLFLLVGDYARMPVGTP